MTRFGLSKGRKENYFVIALGIVLVVITLSISLLVTNKSTGTPQQIVTIPTPSPRVTVTPLSTEPVVQYNKTAQAKLLDKKVNRQELSLEDKQARQRLIALLPSGEIAGVIYKTPTISVEYIQSLDLFKVEILTTDVASAKSEATVWFRSKGMSQKGICDLPLGFYLNWNTANELKIKDFTFSPLANGC